MRKQLLFQERILECRAQPAHLAACFFCGALGVQCHQTQQQLVARGGKFWAVGAGGQACLEVGPAVGLQHGIVQLVMQGFEHADQPGAVDLLFFGCEWAAFAQGLQHVVQAGECEVFGWFGRGIQTCRVLWFAGCGWRGGLRRAALCDIAPHASRTRLSQRLWCASTGNHCF